MTSSAPPSGSRAGTEVVPLRFGKYLLERRIAVGGSSEVFLARPVQGVLPAARLVIKRLLPVVLEDPHSLGTFAMEARLHRAARHPNVVEVFEAGSVDGEPYLAMEYVDGLDTYRLMRRVQAESRPISPQVAIYIALQLCSALSCVHSALDDSGHPLAVVHRDVTPSNIYLAKDGTVKLGDFGIARQLSRTSVLPETSPLKGKYSYLSPEQVAGEDFDHRADLFSLGVVLAEMIINQSLFPGSGQLAVLLSIRDCRIDRIYEAAPNLPPGLLQVLEKALARHPADRFSAAEHFAKALGSVIENASDRAKMELAGIVGWASGPSPHSLPRGATMRPALNTHELSPLMHVRTSEGETLGPFAYAKLVEMTATGQLQSDDQIDVTGTGFQRIADMPDLERHIPPSTATTGRLSGPGVPDLMADLRKTGMLSICARMLARRETGVLFAERDDGDGYSTRKEIYLAQAKVIHVASTKPSELFGEYLVRRRLLARNDLDMALSMLPRYGGRIGDTLIGLNLMDAVEIYRAIRDQGRDRVTEIFGWKTGRVTFYRDVAPQRVEFPLDLDLAPLMFVGAEATCSDEQLVTAHQPLLDDLLVGAPEVPDSLKLAAWPPEVLKVIGAAGEGRSEREILAALTAARLINMSKAMRAIDVACAAGLLERIPEKW